MAPTTLSTPPPAVVDTIVSFPELHILLVTLNRPRHLNAIHPAQHFALDALWQWYDSEPSLRVAILTGAGRAFCAGADLKDWSTAYSSEEATTPAPVAVTPAPVAVRASARFPGSGFGGISNRSGVKPVIAAVNGLCFGGGMEMAINCDLVVASEHALFSLPEVKIGLIALAGALPRLAQFLGRQRASEMALAGGRYSAKTMKSWGLVNEVVDTQDKSSGGQPVVRQALVWANKIVANSPDSVIVSRQGLNLGWESIGPEAGTKMLLHGWFARLEDGENMQEGITSFVEKRKPVWKGSRL